MTTALVGFSLSVRSRLVLLTGLFAFGVVLLTALLIPAARLNTNLSAIATACFLGVMAIPIAAVGRTHPFPRLGPANAMTTLRTALVTIVIALLMETPSSNVAWVAVVVASVAALLDSIDGWLARRSQLCSAFGARFDMEIDALLILVLGAFAWRHDKAGAWVLLSGALRYLFLATSWRLEWFRHDLPPSTRRKAVCVIQIVALIVAIGPVIPRPLSDAIAGLSLALLAWSFGVDVQWLARRRVSPAITTTGNPVA